MVSICSISADYAPEGITVFLGNRLAGLVDGLNDLGLRGDGHLHPCEIVCTLVDVEVDIELQAVCLSSWTSL